MQKPITQQAHRDQSRHARFDVWQQRTGWIWSDCVPILFLASVAVSSILMIVSRASRFNLIISIAPTSPLATLIPVQLAVCAAFLLPRYRRNFSPPAGRTWLLLPAFAGLQWLASSLLDSMAAAIAPEIAFPSNGSGSAYPTLNIVLLLFVQPLLLAPIVEELVFRQWLPERSRWLRSPGFNAAVFALLHVAIVAPDTLLMMLRFAETFLAGYMLMIARLRSGSVVLPIVLHSVFNIVMNLTFVT